MKKLLTGTIAMLTVFTVGQVASACTAGMVMSQSEIKHGTDDYILIRDVIVTTVKVDEDWVTTEAVEAATGTVLYEYYQWDAYLRSRPDLKPARETAQDIVDFLSWGSRTSLHNLPDEYLTNGETDIYGFPIRTHDLYNGPDGNPKDTPYVNMGSVGHHLTWHGREWENGWGAQDGDLVVEDPWWTDEPDTDGGTDPIPSDHAG